MVVLINTAGPVGADDVAEAIAALILDLEDDAGARRYAGDVTPFVGTYRGPGRGRELVVAVAADSGGLTVRMGRGEPRTVGWLRDLTFAAGTTRYTFVPGSGDMTALRVDQVSGLYVLRRDE